MLRNHIGDIQDRDIFETRIVDAGDVRAAQQAYVAAGQGVAFWMPKVDQTMAAIANALLTLQLSATGVMSKGALDEAGTTLGEFSVVDKRITPRWIRYERADLWIGIAIVAAFTLVAGLGFALKSDSSHAALLLPLLVSSMISLKSAFVRSDTGHITQATSLLLFAFVLIGALYFRNVRSFKTPVILWSGMFGLLWLSWPWAGFYAASDIFVAAGNSPFQKLMRMRASSSSVESVLPDELAAAVAGC